MHPIVRSILQRVGLGIITLFIVTLIVFASLEMLPGGFAEALLGQSATPAAIATLNRELGLDRPAAIRYFEWLGGVLHGDFGYSYAGGAATRPVAELLAPRLYNTFFLAALTAVVAVPLALLLGILATVYRGGWFDRITNPVTLTTTALPEFFIAYVLMYFLAIEFRWFHSLSTVSDSTTFLEQLSRAALPALTLTLVILAHMVRMTRTALVDLMASPYVEMARLKGLSRWRIVIRHALPNAWAPIVTVIAFNLAFLVVGVVVVEVVFVYPGIGQMVVDAVSSRDIPVVQACTLVFAVTYIFLNLSADIVSIATNPRLVHPR